MICPTESLPCNRLSWDVVQERLKAAGWHWRNVEFYHWRRPSGQFVMTAWRGCVEATATGTFEEILAALGA